jgi:hypothetical protein
MSFYTLPELVEAVEYLVPRIRDVEHKPTVTAIKLAFREMKGWDSLEAERTVRFARRIDLAHPRINIKAKSISDVLRARPLEGVAIGTSGTDVFSLAVSINSNYYGLGNGVTDISPVARRLLARQIRNTLTTDLNFSHHRGDRYLYITHAIPLPSQVTIRYVPDYQSVEEIDDERWSTYLLRLSVAYLKMAIGQVRGKVNLPGSVQLGGERLIQEANEEFAQIRAEVADSAEDLLFIN